MGVRGVELEDSIFHPDVSGSFHGVGLVDSISQPDVPCQFSAVQIGSRPYCVRLSRGMKRSASESNGKLLLENAYKITIKPERLLSEATP